MTRAAATWTAAVAVVVLGALLGVVHVPYAVLAPGPVCNTVGAPHGECPAVGDASSLIVVPAAADHPSTSRLGFTTVSEYDGEPSIATALWAWLSSSHAVVPREVLHPPSEPAQEQQQQDVQDMKTAQDAAVVTAEAALGEVHAQVDQVVTGSPAASALEPGDLVLAVDGRPVADAASLLQAVQGGTADQTYQLAISRGGRTSTVALRKATIGGRLLFGFTPTNAPEIPVTLTLDPNRIGGPSAGLMFALGVYDRLTPGDLTGSAVVAGTGTIDPVTFAVGAIGGIQQKMYAARHDFHATVFLAPRSNCSDVRGAVPGGLRVVPVSTFADALGVLAKVRSGDLAGLASC